MAAIDIYREGLESVQMQTAPSSVGFVHAVGPTLRALRIAVAERPGEKRTLSRTLSEELVESMRAHCHVFEDAVAWVHTDAFAAFAELL